MARAKAGHRADYVVFHTISTRWSDNDQLGHLNNAVYYSIFDTAVSRWQLENGITIDGPDPVVFMVVENGCRYFSEVGFPDILNVGVRIGHIGTSSVRFEIGVFANDEDTASAEGFFTQVHVGKDRRPAPMTDRVRKICEPLLRVG